jgi:hypothetical protein
MATEVFPVGGGGVGTLELEPQPVVNTAREMKPDKSISGSAGASFIEPRLVTMRRSNLEMD